jgi:hypothetical protein
MLQLPMFRAIRTAILLCIAFAAGILYADLKQRERCAFQGGEARDGVCLGVTG